MPSTGRPSRDDAPPPRHGPGAGAGARDADRPSVFETARLVAREWSSDDVDAALALYGDPEVVRYIGNDLMADRAAMAERMALIIERNASLTTGFGSWPLFRRGDGLLVGCGLLKELPDRDGRPSGDVEIGWHLRRDAWGQGFATETGRALCALGFERHGLETLHAVVEPANEASIAVTRRLGMEPLGRTTAYYRGIELEHFVLRAETWRAGEQDATGC